MAWQRDQKQRSGAAYQKLKIENFYFDNFFEYILCS